MGLLVAPEAAGRLKCPVAELTRERLLKVMAERRVVGAWQNSVSDSQGVNSLSVG